MKTSTWSTAALPATLDRELFPVEKFRFHRVGRTIYLFLQFRDGKRKTCRMRIAMNPTEARRLAFDLAAMGKLR